MDWSDYWRWATENRPLSEGVLLVSTIVFGFLGFRSLRALRLTKRAESLVNDQFTAIDEADVMGIRNRAIPPKDRALFDELLDAVRNESGEAVIRQGSLFWILGVIAGKYPRAPVVSCVPPAAATYDARHDIGAPLIIKSSEAFKRGRVVESCDYLQQGAVLGSPACMFGYGMLIVSGELPGKEADPSGIVWLEKGAAAGYGVGEFGELLLDGHYLPADRERGLALCEIAAATGDVKEIMPLAALYYWGRKRVPKDETKAVELIMKTAPRLRRWIHRHGGDQSDWAELKLFDAVQKEASSLGIDTKNR